MPNRKIQARKVRVISTANSIVALGLVINAFHWNYRLMHEEKCCGLNEARAKYKTTPYLVARCSANSVSLNFHVSLFSVKAVQH